MIKNIYIVLSMISFDIFAIYEDFEDLYRQLIPENQIN